MALNAIFCYNSLMVFSKKHTKKLVGVTTAISGALFLLVISYGVSQPQDIDTELAARLLPAHMRGKVVWKTISAEQVHKGASVPPHINVLFHIPTDVERITRRTLFGRRGQDIRYWGYCFPEDYSADALARKQGLPGKVFLSELEQTKIQIKLQQDTRKFKTLRNMTEDDLNEADSIRGIVRHQKEIFRGGDTCYIMTEKPLPIGVDEDGDGANSKIESMSRTYSYIADTDKDGLPDGMEIFGATHPTKTDSDGDGLDDGIEDKNKNGRIDIGETSPAVWDSDHDGLCDGYCVVDYSITVGYSAPVYYVPQFDDVIYYEDKNLNGIVDEGETDPTKRDTDEDGIFDDQEFFNCVLTMEDKIGDCEPS